ncbi:MAG TPA: methyltransferase [Flavobacteriales bacterium]|nr:methyltransferase [Crocinitomicaceae bacterium]HAE31477.1 methyltransferase [Flavobacteriales bacterium]|tara:strand:+ start:3455 stop:4096 length:642 start_codon:yes stop_codon:yes gene_type:complete
MDFLPTDIENYVETFTSGESKVLHELNRETNQKFLIPRMLSGHLQGRVLSLFSHLLRPRRILEIGTYTGYSALCLAEGLQSDGKLITIDVNEELEDVVNRYVQKSGLSEKIEFRIGNAMELIPEMNELFDLVFIDADKTNYSNYFDLVIDKVRPGGCIIADNVLWSGKVIHDKENQDEDTTALVAYNQKVQNDPRVENVLMPVRDGLMIARKL